MVPASAEEFLEDLPIKGAFRVCQLEQGHAGAELHGVGGAENAVGIAKGLVQKRLGDGAQIPAQRGICGKPPCFVKAVQAVEVGCGAVSQSPKLREDVPHPVTVLSSAADLCQCPVKIPGVDFIKAAQFVHILHSSTYPR